MCHFQRFPARLYLIALFSVALLSTGGCLLPRRDRQETLRHAEAQYDAVRLNAHTALESDTKDGLVRVAGYPYEYGLVAPLSLAVSTSINYSLFALNELVQLALPIIWWTGYQDDANDLTIALYERGASFDRLHDLFPTAPGGVSYTSWPVPALPSRKRGDQP